MDRLMRTGLFLVAVAQTAHSHECSGSQPPSSLISHVKFDLHCSHLAFSEELDNISPVTSSQDCANYCAIQKGCQIAVFDDANAQCVLKRGLDAGDELVERDDYHSLVRVGFVNGTDNSGNSGQRCSQDELNKGCADIAQTERDKAAAQCAKEKETLKRDSDRDRAERERVERECGENMAKEQDAQKALKRDCQAELERERQKREDAVRAERERVEHRLRKEIERAVQEERDRLNEEWSQRLKDAEQKAKQCTADQEKAAEERDRLKKECDRDIREEKDKKDRCEEQRAADRDDVDRERDRLNKQCDDKLDEEKAKKNRCESQRAADRDHFDEQKDRLNRQCDDKVREEKDKRDRCESQRATDRDSINEEKDRLNKQCADDLQRERTKCGEEIDQLKKKCDERQANDQTRHKDDICYNPGFTAWPDNITEFAIDDAKYTTWPKSDVSLSFPEHYDSTSPAACARDHCNNKDKCFGIGWNPNETNKCTAFMDSDYRKVKKEDRDSHPRNWMIVKSNRVA